MNTNTATDKCGCPVCPCKKEAVVVPAVQIKTVCGCTSCPCPSEPLANDPRDPDFKGGMGKRTL